MVNIGGRTGQGGLTKRTSPGNFTEIGLRIIPVSRLWSVSLDLYLTGYVTLGKDLASL